MLMFNLIIALYSELKYKTLYSGGVRIGSFKGISLVGEYTTIPQYRVSEDRIKAGIVVESGKLWIKPEISFPINGEHTTGRVICNFGYTIGE